LQVFAIIGSVQHELRSATIRYIASFAALISAAACVFNQRRIALIMEQQNKSSKAPEIKPKKSAQVGAFKNFTAVNQQRSPAQVKYSAVVVNFSSSKQTGCSCGGLNYNSLPSVSWIILVNLNSTLNKHAYSATIFIFKSALTLLYR
jgi:hypothetical protein